MWFHPSYHLVWASPLPFDVGYLFLVGSNIFLSMVVQQRVVILKFLYSKIILEFLQERRNTHPSNPPSWNLSGSMKLWAMPCRATQDRQVMVESSDKTWSTGEGNGKPLQYSCLENPMNSMKRQKDNTPSRSVGAQYATGDQWRNNSRNNEEMEPKQKQNPAVDVTRDRSKFWCCKEQYFLGT